MSRSRSNCPFPIPLGGTVTVGGAKSPASAATMLIGILGAGHLVLFRRSLNH